MIRLIITLLFVILFLVLGLPVMGVEWIVTKINKHAGDMAALRTVQWAFKVCLFLSGVKADIRGLENLPTDPEFIAKKEFKKVPLLNLWMMMLYCLFLDRKDTKQGLKTILTAIEHIKQGISMFVFPEGTRSKDGKMQEFKAGAFKIATKTGCPIIPVVMSGTADIFENHLPFIKSGPVVVTIGEPIDVNSLDKDEKKHISDYTHKIMEDMLVINNKELEDKLSGQKRIESDK